MITVCKKIIKLKHLIVDYLCKMIQLWRSSKKHTGRAKDFFQFAKIEYRKKLLASIFQKEAIC